MSSVQVYKVVKPKELRGLFLPYHTMDPAQAIERILEAKNLIFDENAELQRQFCDGIYLYFGITDTYIPV
jgi:hypothetical protein